MASNPPLRVSATNPSGTDLADEKTRHPPTCRWAHKPTTVHSNIAHNQQPPIDMDNVHSLHNLLPNARLFYCFRCCCCRARLERHVLTGHAFDKCPEASHHRPTVFHGFPLKQASLFPGTSECWGSLKSSCDSLSPGEQCPR